MHFARTRTCILRTSEGHLEILNANSIFSEVYSIKKFSRSWTFSLKLHYKYLLLVTGFFLKYLKCLCKNANLFPHIIFSEMFSRICVKIGKIVKIQEANQNWVYVTLFLNNKLRRFLYIHFNCLS